MPLIRRQRRPAPASRARLQSRQLPAHAGDARADQRLVADEPKEKLIKIGAKVVSHGRYVAFQMAEVAIPKPLRRHPAADRGTATAASHVNSMRRSVSRVHQNQQETCVLTAKSSALSLFDWLRRASASSADGPAAVRRRVRACQEHETLAGWALTGNKLVDVG